MNSSKNISLSQNNYLIVGASSDIAFPLIEIISIKEPNANLYLLARNVEKLNANLSKIKTLHKFSIISHDILTQKIPIQKDWGINYVIIFSGIIPVSNSPADHANSLRVNFTGIVEMTELIVETYSSTLKNILITTSTAGVRVRKNNYIYGSAKAGLIGYCSGLRHKLYPNIHVTTLIPGFIQTQMVENLKLPKLLTESPQNYAAKIYAAIFKRKNFVYSSLIWQILSFVLRNLPESVLLSMGFQITTKP